MIAGKNSIEEVWKPIANWIKSLNVQENAS
jgi:hypothetical protein